jgi:hypothetical protein
MPLNVGPGDGCRGRRLRMVITSPAGHRRLPSRRTRAAAPSEGAKTFRRCGVGHDYSVRRRHVQRSGYKVPTSQAARIRRSQIAAESSRAERSWGRCCREMASLAGRGQPASAAALSWLCLRRRYRAAGNPSSDDHRAITSAAAASDRRAQRSKPAHHRNRSGPPPTDTAVLRRMSLSATGQRRTGVDKGRAMASCTATSRRARAIARSSAASPPVSSDDRVASPTPRISGPRSRGRRATARRLASFGSSTVMTAVHRVRKQSFNIRKSSPSRAHLRTVGRLACRPTGSRPI